jgi:hypothetical protein
MLDVLNVNKMNVKPGGKQTWMCNTTILLNNPLPKSGEPDTCGPPQSMVFPLVHPNPYLAGVAKGM